MCDPCGTFAGLVRQLVSTSVDRNVREELVEVFEDARRSGPFGAQSRPWAVAIAQNTRLEVVGRDLERIRSGPLRHLTVIRVEHVAQLHAEHRVATRANRGPGAARR